MPKLSVPELGQPLADQSPAPTIYDNFAGAGGVKQAFLDHVKATNDPESFPGLCHTKPAERQPRFLLVVDEFAVDPLKRADADFIRCAACATKKKFKRGSLAWYPDEGVIRVIGNECGDIRRAEAVADYKRRNRIDILTAHLSEHLPNVHRYLADIEAFRPAARHAQELALQLRTQAPTFGQTVMRAVKEGHGALTVFEKELRADGQERPVVFARPVGVDFLRPKFQPQRLLDDAVIRLRQADRGSPSKARRWLHGHRDKADDLAAAHANLRAGLAKFDEARAMVLDAVAFLSEANLNAIDRWSAAHSSPIRARWSAVFLNFAGPRRAGINSTTTSLHPKWALLGRAAPND